MSLIIKSIEYYLPDNIVTNEDLQKENLKLVVEIDLKKSELTIFHKNESQTIESISQLITWN